ncbi:hypothetical protein Pedsa_3748 [Pseudopedobacter saltans DSM 12145]|uniref:Lipoprotein n=1 Tax=Pseudopedobacter saltans (strain ATCC 51119 / DSM 12145 / JCM 21818 / CCUG 39354 / LMG 10337 / NBRC 100064 / NCIMB 13643) TaxID=762903 RepID=F0S6F1_PSESL|nr:hypothetical protein [Pseudopedobacter saltans]ADY54277.1 hypothetical protein Pedsa_3748 [Pseudopedobacter saltans DSM 12145]
MIMRSGMVVLLIILTSCNAFKHRIHSLSKENIRFEEQSNVLREHLRIAKEREDKELEQQLVTQLEIIADSLWYWHPDSGLLPRPGMLKVRYKLKGLNRQRQKNSKTGIEAILLKDLIVKKNQINSEHKVNTRVKETKIDYWVLVILVVALFLLYRKGYSKK